MNHFDFIVLGGGPSALSVFEHIKRNNKETKGLMIVENYSEEGAYSKGAKSVNSIITKLPFLRQSSLHIYHRTIQMKKASEILLKEIYDTHHCYMGKSNIGFRYCRSKEEYITLQSIKDFFYNSGTTVTDLTANFLNDYNIKNINKELLFPFEERVWDIKLFREIFLDKIGLNSIWLAQKVQYIGSAGSIIHLSVCNADGKVETISVNKLIVCKGVGNLYFEDEVKLVESVDSLDYMAFKLLKYYKCIYKPKIILPKVVTSITIPEEGIYFTNEQAEELSILYNLNSPFSPTNTITKEIIENEKSALSDYVFRKYPLVSANLIRDFMCHMTVDANAHRGDIEKHFQFIISNSVSKNIRYINLPYFSVIATALNYLSFDLNKL